MIVSHASTTKTIDFSPNSLISTAVLAWYTDVKHEVKPVTSGYRLALTYNLIHVASPGVVQTGISYALQKLATFDVENSLLPTADMKIWVDRIVSKSPQLNQEQALKMLDLAMKWKDVDIFKTIMKAPVCTRSVVNIIDVLSKAWKIFSFEAVQPRSV